MKTVLYILTILSLILASCRKDENSINANGASSLTAVYSSVDEFFIKNGVPLQTFTVSASAGGNFTTPQGTHVMIPADAFQTQTGGEVTGVVTIQLKDIYKKSDMLLSNMCTNMVGGPPLKSGGEFFIKAIQNNSALKLKSGKSISVEQPTELSGGIDFQNPMQAFVFNPNPNDTMGWAQNPGWASSYPDTVLTTANNYVYSLYQFSDPVDSGTWLNTDNNSYFNAYQQTVLTINPTDSVSQYQTMVFLVFDNINTTVSLSYYASNFPYYYAPEGLQCTVVAIGVKNGKLYSSFVPITISSNMSVNFSLSEITTSDFKNALMALN